MYNLLLDTKFTNVNNNWKFHNCKYENGYLISTGKVFGIEQELVLPEPTKLYFRCNYRIENGIKEVKIGIQNTDILEIERKFPKINKNQSISIVDNAKQEKIKVHLIFESDKEENKVHIEKPIMVDLIAQHKSTWLKIILDRTVNYLNGYIYDNQYEMNEIKPDCKDFIDSNLERAKIGSIIEINKDKEVNISAKFIESKYYLVKLDFEEINKFGDIYFQYGVLKSIRDKDQLYLLIRAKKDIDLKLIFKSKELLPYKINLKHILIIDITDLNLQQEDIAYLPFIGD